MKENDPIIGVWELVKDSAEQNGPSLMYEDDDAGVIMFKAGNVQSFDGLEIDSTDSSISGPSYFVAKTDGKKIYGKCERCISIMETGNDFEFEYRYNKGKDRLIITKNGVEYVYRRVKNQGW